MRADQFGVDGSSDQPGERGQAFRVAVNVQALVGEIADARREETDAAIRRGAGVSTVLDHYGLGLFALDVEPVVIQAPARSLRSQPSHH